MRRAKANLLVDIGCLLTFIPTLLSGLVLYLYLPSGGGRGSSWATWMGIARHDWIFWHDAAGFAFAILILIHLLLHGTFFRNIPRTLSSRETDSDEECS